MSIVRTMAALALGLGIGVPVAGVLGDTVVLKTETCNPATDPAAKPNNTPDEP